MKNMLTAEDLQKIGKELGRVIEDNITPQLQAMYDKIDSIESRMVTRFYFDKRFDTLEEKVNQKFKDHITQYHR